MIIDELTIDELRAIVKADKCCFKVDVLNIPGSKASFRAGEYYKVEQTSAWIFVWDDDNNQIMMTYDEARNYLVGK